MDDLNNLLSTLDSLTKNTQNSQQSTQNPPAAQPQSAPQQNIDNSLAGLLSSLQSMSNPPLQQQTTQTVQQTAPSTQQQSQSQSNESGSLASLLSSLSQGSNQQQNTTSSDSNSNALAGLLSSLQQQNSAPAPTQNSSTSTNNSLSFLSSMNTTKTQPAPTQISVTTTTKATTPTGSIVKHNYTPFDPLLINIPSFQEISAQFDSTSRLSPGESIQSMISNAMPNTVIEIPAGVYNEELTIVKPIVLRAVGGKVEIHGKGESDVIIIKTAYCELDNLDIIQVNTSAGNAVTISDGFTKITNCRIKSELLSSLYTEGQSQVLVENSQLYGPQNPILSVTDNSFVKVKSTKFSNTKTHGIMAEKSSSLVVENCQFEDIENTGIAASDTARVYVKTSSFSQIRNVGIDTLSTIQIVIDECTFSNITQCGVSVYGDKHSALVKNCTFTKCDLTGIKATDKGLIRTLGNHFIDIGDNTMILADNSGIVQAEKDQFEGNSLTAIGAFSQGEVQCRGLTFSNIRGHAFLSYNQGKIEADLCQITTQSTQPAIHSREGSDIKLSRITIDGGQSAGIFISDNSTGEVFDSVVMNTATIGIELAHLNSFNVGNCDFSNNRIAGISVHETVQAVFENCQINQSGNVGCDVSSANTSPVFINCKFNQNKEAGCICQEQASPRFIGCTFDSNPKIGFCVKESNAQLDNCVFSHNGSAGISVYSGAKGVFTNCEFDSNHNFAGQIFGEGSHCKLVNCKIHDHAQSVSFYISDHSKLRCVNTSIINSGQLHFSVQSSALSFRNCDLGETTGAGIQIVDGTTKMKQTTIHNCQKVAMIIGKQGNVKILDNSSIRNNQQAGLVCFADSTVYVKESAIESNGGIGIQAPEQCELTVEKCTIRNQGQYGIIIGKDTKLNDLGNNFSNNGRKDIEIMQR